MAGFQPEDAFHVEGDDFCEVVNIGEEDEASEVTIFYRPDKGFKVPNAYLVSRKRRQRHGRHYTRLDIISAFANRLIVRRYDNGDYHLETRGFWIERESVTL